VKLFPDATIAKVPAHSAFRIRPNAADRALICNFTTLPVNNTVRYWANGTYELCINGHHRYRYRYRWRSLSFEDCGIGKYVAAAKGAVDFKAQLDAALAAAKQPETMAEEPEEPTAVRNLAQEQLEAVIRAAREAQR